MELNQIQVSIEWDFLLIKLVYDIFGFREFSPLSECG